MTPPPASAIILAAGESTRMGRPKALLPWGDGTLLDYHVAELRAAGVDDIVVVLGHGAEAIRPRVPAGVRVAVNNAYREGRASSLRAGAAAVADDSGPIIVLNVDQPRPRRVFERLLREHREAKALVTLPVSDGQRGHPAVLAAALRPELRAATEEAQGLRGIIAAHEDALRPVHYAMVQHESAMGDLDLTALIVRLDLDTPEDYENALMLFGLGRR
jgi:molybdenum cofactor cytidylyltransferase